MLEEGEACSPRGSCLASLWWSGSRSLRGCYATRNGHRNSGLSARKSAKAGSTSHTPFASFAAPTSSSAATPRGDSPDRPFSPPAATSRFKLSYIVKPSPSSQPHFRATRMPPRGGVKKSTTSSSQATAFEVDLNGAGPSKLVETATYDAPGAFGLDEDQMAWASTEKTTWKGKGLTDDIKTVEVRFSLAARSGRLDLTMRFAAIAGQVAASPCVPESQGSGQAASGILRPWYALRILPSSLSSTAH